MSAADQRSLLKRLVELVQPDLRKYYRMPRKGRIVASYPSEGGQWFADVQPLRNDESEDTNEPVLPKLELPVLWGGINRGVVCPPAVGTYCVIGYLDGDPSYPFIMDIRWYDQQAPAAELTEFIIQQEPGVYIKVDKAHKIITVTPSNIEHEIGENWTVNVGDSATITVGKDATIKAGSEATVQAPQINLVGNLANHGKDGGIATAQEKSHKTHEGSYSLQGPQSVIGSVTISGNLAVGGVINGKVAGCQGCGG